MPDTSEDRLRQRLMPLESYRALIDGETFLSDWLTVDQAMIDRFADATLDHQFIHVDVERARAEGPYGGTVAHGFLSLSLLSRLAYDAMPGVEGSTVGVNYGFDRVRFLSPVRSGARVRGSFRLKGLVERAVTIQSTWDASVEIEGSAKPALNAQWITVSMLQMA